MQEPFVIVGEVIGGLVDGVLVSSWSIGSR